MSRSEFRWNKKRKHYAYFHKDKGSLRRNILITSKPHVIKHKNGKIKIVLNNVRLVRTLIKMVSIMLLLRIILIVLIRSTKKSIRGNGISMISARLNV